MLKVFISHSSSDASLAELLIHLLRDSLGIAASEVRCTSVDGYRLPGGADTDERLRTEISDSQVFVGLLSHASLNSTYVTFELGARWGVKKHLIPLMAPGLTPEILKGPVAALNALSCASASQMHQFVTDVASQIKIHAQPAAAYQKWIDQIVSYKSQEVSTHRENGANRGQSETSSGIARSEPQHDQDDIAGIKKRAAQEHPGDFSTQRYVINEQVKALTRLRNFSDPSVPDDVIREVLSIAANDHPSDFSTQLYVVQEQLASWKHLNS